MLIHFIRHGQPDYSNIKNTDPIYFSNLSPLTEKGINQANEINIENMKNSQIIIVSPYTRTMQTAAILSKNINKNILVNENLHEWLPDKTYQSKIANFTEYNKLFLRNECDKCNCETMEDLKIRLLKELDIYKEKYNEIIIVADQRLISSLINKDLKYCEVFDFTY